MKLWKAIKATVSGILATAGSVDMPDAGVSVEYTPKNKNKEIRRKLDAASEALRKIECLTHDCHYSQFIRDIHELARDGWRDSKK